MNSNLTALLAVRQYKIDQSVGIRRMTPQVASLLMAYNRLLKRNIQIFTLASTAKAVLESGEKRMEEIYQESRSITEPEPRRRLIEEAQEICDRSEAAQNILQKLDDGLRKSGNG